MWDSKCDCPAMKRSELDKDLLVHGQRGNDSQSMQCRSIKSLGRNGNITLLSSKLGRAYVFVRKHRSSPCSTSSHCAWELKERS